MVNSYNNGKDYGKYDSSNGTKTAFLKPYKTKKGFTINSALITLNGQTYKVMVYDVKNAQNGVTSSGVSGTVVFSKYSKNNNNNGF